MTFSQLLQAAGRDRYEVEQIALRRVVFARRVTAVYSSRIVARLSVDGGWKSNFPRQRMRSSAMAISVREACHYYGESDPYRAQVLSMGGHIGI